jgi:predicted tellurium resistance membrane protein TerC
MTTGNDAIRAAAGHSAWMVELLSSPEAWVSLATLAALEIVLGVDNIIFIAILAGRLPESQRERARKLGLTGAFVSRMGLLATISWIVKLDQPLFEIAGKGLSGKSLILLLGGGFLLFKATREIHHKLETANEEPGATKVLASFSAVIVQIVLLDMVFSIDSVITAVGMTDHISVMVAANVIALIVMVAVGGSISNFVEKHPSVKVLALSFLLMIGLVLVAESFGVHIPKGYIYGAMGFSVFVEMINLRTARKTKPGSGHLPHGPDISGQRPIG